jgi:hypothetical protein
LLDDDLRANQQKYFCDWIRAENATDASALARRAMAAIEKSAESFGTGDPKQSVPGSLITSTAMIWKVKKQPVTTDPRESKGK